MLTFIELLIGVVVIVGVARYIIKGYSATGVLFVGGLLLLIISAIMGHKVLPSSQASTGYSATDIVEYYSAAIFLIPICISFDTDEKRR